MITIFTLGYQGQSIATFLDTLLGHGVERVLDVRQLPFSRKPDFTRKRLTAHLAEAGIAYTHIAALGTPKELRDEVRRTGDHAAFFAALEPVIAAQAEALDEALALAAASTCALLCFEASAAECHRTVVAAHMARRSPEPLRVVDL